MKQESKPNQPIKQEVLNLKIKYVFEWFDKKTESLVGEEVLPFNIDEMQELLGINEILIDCWAIDNSRVSALQKFTTHNIDLNKYDYFICGQQA